MKAKTQKIVALQPIQRYEGPCWFINPYQGGAMSVKDQKAEIRAIGKNYTVLDKFGDTWVIAVGGDESTGTDPIYYQAIMSSTNR